MCLDGGQGGREEEMHFPVRVLADRLLLQFRTDLVEHLDHWGSAAVVLVLGNGFQLGVNNSALP